MNLFFIYFKDDTEDVGDYDNLIVQHMNIEEPLTTLRKLLEHRLSCSLADHDFYLQDSIKVKKEYNRKLEKFSMIQNKHR